MTGKMSRKGFFATLAAAIGSAGAATGAKAVGGVDRYAVVSVPRKYTMAMGAANVVKSPTSNVYADIVVHGDVCSMVNDLAASLRRHGITL